MMTSTRRFWIVQGSQGIRAANAETVVCPSPTAAVPRRRRATAPSRIYACLLAVSLVLASGPVPAAIAAKHEDRRGAHTTTQRGENRPRDRGQIVERRKATAAKKTKHAKLTAGKRNGKSKTPRAARKADDREKKTGEKRRSRAGNRGGTHTKGTKERSKHSQKADDRKKGRSQNDAKKADDPGQRGKMHEKKAAKPADRLLVASMGTPVAEIAKTGELEVYDSAPSADADTMNDLQGTEHLTPVAEASHVSEMDPDALARVLLAPVPETPATTDPERGADSDTERGVTQARSKTGTMTPAAPPMLPDSAPAEANPTAKSPPAAAAEDTLRPPETMTRSDDPTATVEETPDPEVVGTATPPALPSPETLESATAQASPVSSAAAMATLTPESGFTSEVTATATTVSAVEPAAPSSEPATAVPSPSLAASDPVMPVVTPIAPENTQPAMPLPEPSTASEPSPTLAAIATVELTPIEIAVVTPQEESVAAGTPAAVASPEVAQAVTPEASPVAPEPGKAPDAIATPVATETGVATLWALPGETATTIPSVSPEPATPAATEATPVPAVATPVALETAPPVSAKTIAVEALTSDLEVTPGEPSYYRFQLTNTVGSASAVQPTAVNSRDGWTGIVLQDDGATRLDGPLTIGPWQSEIVIVEVTVPVDARVGDRNIISLRLQPASVEKSADLGGLPELEPLLEPDDAESIEDGPRDRDF